MTTEPTSAEALFERHLQAAIEHDLTTVMLDYTDDSVMMVPTGPVVGRAAIEAVFRDVIFPMLNDDFMKVFKLLRKDVANDTVYLLWEAPGIASVGVDTFVYRDGKIVAQTFAMHPAS